MSSCPTEAILRQLGMAQTGDTTCGPIEPQVEQHVESCDKCQAFLQGLVKNDLEHPASHLPAHGSSANGSVSGDHSLPTVPGFVIERELGRGRNGIVYLAKETALDRSVALKIVAAREEPLAKTHAQWVSEAQAISRFRHPQIVRIHQVIELPPRTVLVLEYVPGGTLRERLTGPLSRRVAAGILETIARTIAFIHKAGLLHLDIKPSNILVEGEPACRVEGSNVMVSDFGIALPFAEAVEATPGSQSSTGRLENLPHGLRGTPSYMSPEQTGATGSPIGPAADIYALGALFYHMLTGRPPFQSPSAAKIVEMVNTIEPAAPRSLNPRIPSDLEMICLQCLRKAPEQRYSSADALADDLRRFLDFRTISLRPASAIDHVTCWCRRRPAIAALTMILALTVVGSFSGLLILLNQSETNRELANAARLHAEENEALTSRSLEGLGGWLQRVLNDPTILTEYQIRGSNINVDHSLMHDSRYLEDTPLGNDESIVRIIAAINQMERDLALKLTNQRSELPEAGDILTRLRRQLGDCVRRWPNAEILKNEVILTVLDSANVAVSQDAFEEAAGYLDDAAALAPAVQDDAFRIGVLASVSTRRREMCLSAKALGDHERAKSLLQIDMRMLETVSPQDALRPEVRLAKAQVLSQLGRRHEVIPGMRELTQLAPDEWLCASDFPGRFYYWLAACGVDIVAAGTD
jgi:serine/threonine protein kinase